MPPANDSPLTATEIASIPYSFIQSDIHDAGTTYSVWYKFTSDGTDGVVSMMFRGAGAYTPSVELYIDNSATLLGTIGAGKMAQVPLLSGRVYYWKVISNGGNPTPAVLTVSLEPQPTTPQANGDIFIRAASILVAFTNAGYTGLGAGVVDPTTGTIKTFSMEFPIGEHGDYMPETGELLFNDETGGFDQLRMYDYQRNLIRSVTYDWTGTHIPIRVSREQRVWYLGDRGQAPTKFAEWFYLDLDGNLSTPVPMGVYGCTAIANSADNLSVYISGVSSSVNTPVKVWDKAGAAFGADFAAAVANHRVCDILVMSTGDVIISWQDQSSPYSTFVRVYNSAGVLQRTWTAPAATYSSSVTTRMCHGNDDDETFWVFLHRPDGFSNFIQVRVSDVSEVTNIETPSTDYFTTDQGDDPDFRFVTSDSCPIVLLISPPLPGLFILVPERRSDNNGEIDEAIPSPTFRTALMP